MLTTINRRSILYTLCIWVLCMSLFNKSYSSSEYIKYSGPEECRAMCWELDAYALEICKQTGMKFYKMQNPTDFDDIYYFLPFQDARQMTLDQGRIFGSKIVEEFVQFLRNNKAVEAYHLYSKSRYRSTSPMAKPFAGEVAAWNQIGLQIAFWDENVERPAKPYLAQILFVNKTFYYYETNPETQALVLLFSESYEDAIAFRNGQIKKD